MTNSRFKLGLKPVDHSRPAVMLGPSLTGTVPAHPATADNASKVADWGMLGNQQFGDCGPCGMEHARMQVTAYLTSTPYVATESDTLAFYKLCDPDFNQATGAGDDGVNLQDMFGVATKYGVGHAKPLGYAKVDHTNLDEVRAAIAIFGSVLFGVDLDVAQQQQTVWDYAPSDEWGGHCVLAVQYDGATDGADIGVVSWGEIIGVSDRFMQHQLTEAWVVLWPEHLGSVEFLAGVDVAQLAADYTAVTGRPFPGGIPPQPTPGPPPQPVPVADPDHALATALNPWAAEHHTGANAAAARAFVAWREAKNLTVGS